MELISSKACPYAQRCLILLLEKKITCKITYIQLTDKPEWFVKLSPLGKVPILKVNDTVLFESAVILEYLDEIKNPALHPEDPLQRALNRGWIEYSSSLIGGLFQWASSNNPETLAIKEELFKQQLQHLEHKLDHSPYFNGDKLALVDIAFAPLWMRLAFLCQHFHLDILNAFPKIQAWSEKLLAAESIVQSAVPDLKELYLDYLKNKGSCLFIN